MADELNPWTWQEAHGYVQGLAVPSDSRTIYCAGQAAVDDHGGPVHAGDMEAQLMTCLDNLEAVLASGAARLAHVVRLTIYVTDINAYFAAAGPVVARLRATGCRPTATLIGVAALFHPDAMVEIEATAAV